MTTQNVKKKKAIVLSGGGAKGAYEAGVLKYIIEHWGLQFNIAVGTSAGALNSFMYSSLDTCNSNKTNAEKMAEPWKNISINKILKLPFDDYLKLKFNSVFDNRQLFSFVEKFFDKEIKKNNIEKESELETLCVITGEMASGQTHVWYESRNKNLNIISQRWLSHRVELDTNHAIASGAIPTVFRAVELEDETGDKKWHNDGGITMNTPISPAIQAGAEKIMIIYLGNPIKAAADQMPTAYEVLKDTVLTLMFYNHLKEDIIRANTVNMLLEKLGKDEFSGYRKVYLQVVAPSKNLDEKAVNILKESNFLMKLIPGFVIELLSITTLLMTPVYTTAMINLGYNDARRMHDQLESFFSD
jgi:NTE family protein